MTKGKRLTIGAATFDDFEGVFFTFQALRLANLERLDELDLVVVDNNPDSTEGEATAQFCKKAGIRYFPERVWRSTAVRNRVFEEAAAPWALCVDPHVLLEPQTIARLLEFIDGRPVHSLGDLYHGPMLYDYLGDECPATHMAPEWRAEMFGTWGHDDRGKDPDGKPFEIPMHGLGLFLSRVASWPGFNPLFQGFGGEEGYIHEKVKQAGGRTWCLPFLRWVHRFQRPRGINYPLNVRERVRNYCIGWIETGKDPQEVLDHFREAQPQIDGEEILADARRLLAIEDPDEALAAVHMPAPEPVAKKEAIPFETRPMQEVWHQTDVELGDVLEIEVFARKFRVKGFSLNWSIR